MVKPRMKSAGMRAVKIGVYNAIAVLLVGLLVRVAHYDLTGEEIAAIVLLIPIAIGAVHKYWKYVPAAVGDAVKEAAKEVVKEDEKKAEEPKKEEKKDDNTKWPELDRKARTE